MAMIEREEEYGLFSGFRYFLWGAAAGIVTGLLVAPKSGLETREDLSDWFQDKKERTNRIVSRLREKLPAAAERAQEAGKEIYSGGQENDRRL